MADEVLVRSSFAPRHIGFTATVAPSVLIRHSAIEVFPACLTGRSPANQVVLANCVASVGKGLSTTV